MKTIDWKRKFTSRKFLAAVAGIVTGLAMIFGLDENTISTVAGAVVSIASVVAYIKTEGRVDEESIRNAAESVQGAVEAVEGVPGPQGPKGDNGVSVEEANDLIQHAILSDTPEAVDKDTNTIAVPDTGSLLTVRRTPVNPFEKKGEQDA